jgi:hypothetical protein
MELATIEERFSARGFANDGDATSSAPYSASGKSPPPASPKTDSGFGRSTAKTHSRAFHRAFDPAGTEPHRNKPCLCFSMAAKIPHRFQTLSPSPPLNQTDSDRHFQADHPTSRTAALETAETV